MHLSQFLLRWLFIDKLLHDRAEIQSIPYTPHMPSTIDSYDQFNHRMSHSMDNNPSEHSYQQNIHPSYPSSHHGANAQFNEHVQSLRDIDEEWKIKALHGIALYPPGMSRLLALDSLRLEIVHDIAKSIYEADELLQLVDTDSRDDHPTKSSNQRGIGEGDGKILSAFNPDERKILSQDSQIQTDFEKTKSTISEDKDKTTGASIQTKGDDPMGQNMGLEMMTPTVDHLQGTRTEKNQQIGIGRNRQDRSATPLLVEKVRHAKALLQEITEYLPQLISISLHSSPSLKHPSLRHLDPLKILRILLINRCIKDPHLGIKVCWLLEAELGRAWKTLFEHRQQTGRRLVVILPADKAAVLAKIGVEKRLTFDFLQDVETATAFGFYDDVESRMGDAWSQPTSDPYTHHTEMQGNTGERQGYSEIPRFPRLPESLSVRRCRHFGDTMYFVDRMTKISLTLKTVPHSHRSSVLSSNLEDLNRRLRRRMISRGFITLDEEDHREPHDWPTIDDITVDMAQYSIHFPLEPKTKTWQGGLNSKDTVDNECIVRILNIVTRECRLLSSRERAPFLVVCEVLDTNLSGNDVRLYNVGADNVDATKEEVYGSVHVPYSHGQSKEISTPASFPSTTLESKLKPNHMPFPYTESQDLLQRTIDTTLHYPRGGWQNNGEDWYHDGTTPFDAIRQQQLEELHQQMSSHQSLRTSFTHINQQDLNMYQMINPGLGLSRDSVLLNRVFGIPWSQKSQEIQYYSPFGQIKGWRLASFIMKAGEDVRREALVMQIISKLKAWFDAEISQINRPYLRPYTIMCVGGDSGLVECVNDAKSINEVKKETDGFTTLRNYFERAYSVSTASRDLGQENQGVIDFATAQINFLRSMVGYSLVCYILQIKDRHNANILLDREGHMMHIDFGFVLGDTPKMAKVPLFYERAPFKLTAEIWEVIGGWNINKGGLGVRFCRMFEEAFECASRHAGEIADMIEAALLSLSHNSAEAKFLAEEVRQRLRLKGPSHSIAQKTFIMDLVNTAIASWESSTYDWLQKRMNGYI